jgi:hypothetical protein
MCASTSWLLFIFCLFSGMQSTWVAEVGVSTAATSHGAVAANKEFSIPNLQARLPPGIRKRLVANACKNYDWEEMSIVPARGQHDDLLSLAQRSLWTENFNNARSSGMNVAEAQEVALRGAADGVLYAKANLTDDEEHPAPIGATLVNRKGTQGVTCMACQHSMPERSQIPPHYSSDWHLLNIERRSLGMRPISETDFPRRVAEAEEEEEKDMSQASFSSVRYRGAMGIAADYARKKVSEKRGSHQAKNRQEIREAALLESNRDMLRDEVDELSPKERRRLDEEKMKNAVIPCEQVLCHSFCTEKRSGRYCVTHALFVQACLLLLQRPWL